MTEQTNEQQGLFVQSQDELTQAVYDTLIYKPRAKAIAKEIRERLANGN